MKNVIYQQMTKRVTALISGLGESCGSDGLIDCVAYIARAYNLTQEQMLGWMHYMNRVGVDSYTYNKGQPVLVMSKE